MQYAVLQLYQRFWRSSRYLHVVARKEKHIRRGVGCAKNTVSVQQAALKISIKTIGQYHLEDVAFIDIVFGTLHHFAVTLLAEQCAEIAFELCPTFLRGLAVPNKLFHLLKLPLRFGIVFIDIVRGNICN